MKITKIVKVRPVDGSSTGFSIPGYKLRWLGATQSENRPGRIWKVLRVDDFDPKVVKELLNQYNLEFNTAKGNTLRRGDMTLAIASNKAAAEHKAELKKLSDESMGVHKTSPGMGMEIEDKSEKIKMEPDFLND